MHILVCDHELLFLCLHRLDLVELQPVTFFVVDDLHLLKLLRF